MALHNDRIKKTLRYSLLDGTFSASMIGFGESFFQTFAVFLRANNIQIGLLMSLPLTLGSLAQLFSNTLITLFGSRKKLVYTAALLQGLMYIPIALVFFFGSFRVYHLILFACLYWLFGMILGPAWNSWMGELVEEQKRGSYFGRRNKITGFATFFSFMISGYILQKLSVSTTAEYMAFVIIFLLAFISRITSVIFLMKKYEPPYAVSPADHFSFIDFIRQSWFRNYGLLTLYLSLMNFSVFLAAPFFIPYMLKDLKLNYISFTIVQASAIIVKFLFMPVWGRISDSFGTKKTLSMAGFLMPLTPILWLFSGNVIYLIIIQCYSGFVWAGFELSSSNFIFDTTSPQKRATGFAYYNVINGFAILLGSLIGGLIVRYNTVFWSQYLLVFGLSCCMRYAASFVFIRKLKEVRMVESIPYTQLFFKIVSSMPTMGSIFQIIPLKRKQNDKLSHPKEKVNSHD